MELIILKRFDNYFYANIACEKLKDAGIICFLRDENTVQIDPLLNYAVGGIKLEVATDQYDEAVELMKQAEQAYQEGLVCEKCGGTGFSLEEKFNNPNTFWGILKNKILYGQTNLYSKKYKCKNCTQLIDSTN